LIVDAMTATGDVSCLRHLQRPLRFESPFPGEEFAALILVAAPDITSEEQGALAQALVAQGCRYAVCAGIACSSWDDAIDQAAVVAEVQGLPTHFVTTTWHDGETLEDGAFFFLEVAQVEEAPPRRRLAIVVGGGSAGIEALENVLQKAGGRPTTRCS
jgi:hypothetical protein